MPSILLGGINRIETVQGAMAEGFELRRHGTCPAARAESPSALAEGPTERGVVRALQQMHAHHLPRARTACSLPPGIAPVAIA